MSEENKAALDYLLNPATGDEEEPDPKESAPSSAHVSASGPAQTPSGYSGEVSPAAAGASSSSKKKRGRKPLNLTEEERSTRESQRKLRKRLRARKWNEEQRIKMSRMEEENEQLRREVAQAREESTSLKHEAQRLESELEDYIQKPK